MGTQQFCLKWNNHQSNMLTVFEQLLSTEALVDVTLACDGLSLKAHKMVLSACSPYFQSLFLENPCKHPIVIMKDMRYTELKAIIDFMYRGEVNVSHDQLNALLRTAETLKVKGLAEVSGENRTAAGMVQQEIVQQNVTTSPATGPPPQTRSDSPTLLSKRKRGRPRKRSLSDSNRSDDEQVPSKIKEPGSPEIEELSGDASIEANDISLSSNSQTQVHQSLPSSSVHNSHLNKHPSSIQSSHDSQVEEPPSDDGDFEVEPSKLMEQTLTTDVPVMSNSTPQSTVAPSVHIVPLSSSSGLDVNTRSIVPSGSESTTLVPASASIASDSLSSSQMQGPDSPQDIKPALLSFEEPPISPVAGPSQDRSMMMYMDTSGVPAIPGTSYQDNQTAIVQHESQPQADEIVKVEIVENKAKSAVYKSVKKRERKAAEKFRLSDSKTPTWNGLSPAVKRNSKIRQTARVAKSQWWQKIRSALTSSDEDDKRNNLEKHFGKNNVEKRRRDEQRRQLQGLRGMVPCIKNSPRTSNIMILSEAVGYINKLKNQGREIDLKTLLTKIRSSQQRNIWSF